MELPNEKTVRADFNNTKFENFGVTTKFFRDGDKYLVETENQNGDMETFEIAYTFRMGTFAAIPGKVSRR